MSNHVETVNHTPCDPLIPILGIYPRGIKTTVHKKTCIRMFIAALFLINNNQK